MRLTVCAIALACLALLGSTATAQQCATGSCGVVRAAYAAPVRGAYSTLPTVKQPLCKRVGKLFARMRCR